MSKSVRTSGSH